MERRKLVQVSQKTAPETTFFRAGCPFSRYIVGGADGGDRGPGARRGRRAEGGAAGAASAGGPKVEKVERIGAGGPKAEQLERAGPKVGRAAGRVVHSARD